MIPMGVYPDPDINDDVNSASWLGDGVSISTEPANKSCIQSAAVKNLDNAGFKPLYFFFVCVFPLLIMNPSFCFPIVLKNGTAEKSRQCIMTA